MPEFLTDDGVVLRYTEHGGGVPVVLIAGFRAPAATWVFQVPHLASMGCRVLCLDRRGHGLSETSQHGHRIARHAADLAQFLDHVSVGRQTDAAVLVGASMGASVIWSYLDNYGYGRVRSVVAVDQTPRMSNTQDWPHGFYGYDLSNLGTFFADGPPVETGHGTPGPAYRERFERLAVAMGDAAGQLRAEPLSTGELALLLDHAVQDWRDVVRRSAVPQLLIAGAESEFWPAQHAVDMASGHPLVTAHTIPDCGHAVPWEAPAAFNYRLAEFLAPQLKPD